MGTSRAELVRAVRILGQRDSVFQFPALRERVGVEADDKLGASKVHNSLKRLIAHGAVEVVPGKRERNRYYRITDEEKLRDFAPAPAPAPAENGGGIPRSPSAGDRLGRIEERLGRIEERLGLFESFSERLEHVDRRLSDLAAVWA